MSDLRIRPRPNDSFKVDKAYLRQQAKAAAKAFVAPLAGVYRAVNGETADKDSATARR